MLLGNSLKKFTIILARALLTQNITEFLSIYVSKISLLAITSSLDNKILRKKSRLTKRQNIITFQFIKIKQNIEICLHNLTGLLDRIFAIIGIDDTQDWDKS